MRFVLCCQNADSNCSQIPKVAKTAIGSTVVGDILKEKDERKNAEEIIDALDLRKLLTRDIKDLSGKYSLPDVCITVYLPGGELQRFCIAVAAMKNADGLFGGY